MADAKLLFIDKAKPYIDGLRSFKRLFGKDQVLSIVMDGSDVIFYAKNKRHGAQFVLYGQSVYQPFEGYVNLHEFLAALHGCKADVTLSLFGDDILVVASSSGEHKLDLVASKMGHSMPIANIDQCCVVPVATIKAAVRVLNDSTIKAWSEVEGFRYLEIMYNESGHCVVVKSPMLVAWEQVGGGMWDDSLFFPVSVLRVATILGEVEFRTDGERSVELRSGGLCIRTFLDEEPRDYGDLLTWPEEDVVASGRELSDTVKFLSGVVDVDVDCSIGSGGISLSAPDYRSEANISTSDVLSGPGDKVKVSLPLVGRAASFVGNGDILVACRGSQALGLRSADGSKMAWVSFVKSVDGGSNGS